MTVFRPAIFALLLASSPLLHADAPAPLVSGLWEVTTTPDFKSIPAALTPKIDRLCLSESAIQSGTIPLFLAPVCSITGGTWQGNRLLLNAVCPDTPPDVKLPAELTAAGKTFTSFIELNPQIRYNHSGKWLAAQCQ